jgi:cytoskeletal protein RodZ
MDPMGYQQPNGHDVSRVGGPDVRNGEMGSSLDCGVGLFLKDERQKKGLDYNQISEITRIRPHLLQAIENEDWDRLPSKVFVKSFIRSYAHALGLAESEIIARYRDEASEITCAPKPIQTPRRSRTPHVIVLACLLAVAALFYHYWRESPAPEETSNHSRSAGAVPDGTVESEPAEIAGAASEWVVPDAQKEWGAASVGDDGPERLGITVETAVDILKRESLRKVSEEEKRPVDKADTAVSAESETERTVTGPELILKASVLEETWIRIFVDGHPPKEYIFRPGSKPEWRADEGFELLVGNAGGIRLELDGREIKKLGPPGQVVRLSLPDGYTRTNLED